MKVEIEVTIPMVPNFIKVGSENRDIKDFTDDQLRAIAKEWTDNLLSNAAKRRIEPIVFQRKGWKDTALVFLQSDSSTNSKVC